MLCVSQGDKAIRTECARLYSGAPMPETAIILLLGTGLVELAWLRMRPKEADRK